MNDSRQRGFTLIELLITLVIVAVVAAIAVVSLLNALDKAKQRATMADMRSISTALEAYMVDYNFPPPTSTSAVLVGLLTPYHSTVLSTSDHWRTDYDYASNGSDEYTLESFGKDGTNGANITLGTRFEFERDIVLANGKFVAAPE